MADSITTQTPTASAPTLPQPPDAIPGLEQVYQLLAAQRAKLAADQAAMDNAAQQYGVTQVQTNLPSFLDYDLVDLFNQGGPARAAALGVQIIRLLRIQTNTQPTVAAASTPASTPAAAPVVAAPVTPTATATA